jgi:hypothetical protein
MFEHGEIWSDDPIAGGDDRGRIIGASRDRTKDRDPDMRRHVQKNRRLGYLSGQSRIRIRYRGYVTPWFDYFRIPPEELSELLDGTGWAVHRLLQSEGGLYVAVIDKQTRPFKAEHRQREGPG